MLSRERKAEMVERAIASTVAAKENGLTNYELSEIAAAAIEAMPDEGCGEAEGWRDIASAPKDGTRVLLKGSLSHSALGEHVVEGWWTGDFFDGGSSYSGWTNGVEIEWGDSGFGGPEEVVATHWRPLPAPPSPRS